MPNNILALVAYLARDYDEAKARFQDALGFILLGDTDQGGGKRWVRMASHADAPTGFLIVKAVGNQVVAIGKSAGGRVAYFLHTDDFGTNAQIEPPQAYPSRNSPA